MRNYDSRLDRIERSLPIAARPLTQEDLSERARKLQWGLRMFGYPVSIDQAKRLAFDGCRIARQRTGDNLNPAGLDIAVDQSGRRADLEQYPLELIRDPETGEIAIVCHGDSGSEPQGKGA